LSSASMSVSLAPVSLANSVPAGMNLFSPNPSPKGFPSPYPQNVNN
jgi:hypothetical protein